MSPIYDQISANRRRTVILVTVFVLLIGLLGWVYGEYSGYGLVATVPAVVFAIIFSTFSYWGGDSIALWTAGAKPIEKKDAPELYRLVENLSIAAGLPMPKIYVMPDPGINAFATGRDPAHASVAVTAGALQKLEKTELEGVLAHELSHVRNYDIRYMLLVAILVGALVLLAAWLRRTIFWGNGRRRNDRESGGNGIFLLVGLLLAILAPLMAELIKLAVSREREYLADASGALLTRYPAGLAGALEKIQRDNEPLDHASEGTAHLYFSNPFGNLNSRVSNLFSTHPPIEERVKRLREMGSLA